MSLGEASNLQGVFLLAVDVTFAGSERCPGSSNVSPAGCVCRARASSQLLHPAASMLAALCLLVVVLNNNSWLWCSITNKLVAGTATQGWG